MKQNISKEALRAVKKFIARASVPEFSIFPEEQLGEKYRRLIASLYALRPDAAKDVEVYLRNFELPLSDYLSQREISTLSKEYSAVVRYCFESIDYSIEGNSATALSFLYYFYFGTRNMALLRPILASKHAERIFFPYTGLLFFPNFFADCEVNSNELNGNLWAFSSVLREVYNIAGTTLRGIGPIEELKSAGKYNCIVANLLSLYKEDTKDYIEDLTFMATSMLVEGGELFCLVNEDFLEEKRWLPVRQAFTSGDLSVHLTQTSFLDMRPFSRNFLIRVTNDHLSRAVLQLLSGEEEELPRATDARAAELPSELPSGACAAELPADPSLDWSAAFYFPSDEELFQGL